MYRMVKYWIKNNVTMDCKTCLVVTTHSRRKMKAKNIIRGTHHCHDNYLRDLLKKQSVKGVFKTQAVRIL